MEGAGCRAWLDGTSLASGALEESRDGGTLRMKGGGCPGSTGRPGDSRLYQRASDLVPALISLGWRAVSVSRGRYSKWPQAGWLPITEMYPLIVPEA